MEPAGKTKRNGSRWAVAITGVVCLLAGSLVGGWYAQNRMAKAVPAAATNITTAPAPPAPAMEEDVVVTIPADAIDRLGLSFAPVIADVARSDIRVPGTVGPDGYRQVSVSPVVGGIATEVTAELGQTVKRGQKMAQLFSQELADAQTSLIAMDAELGVEHKRLLRVQELVQLGAASREELEAVEAAHQLHVAHIEQARQKLLLLGLSPAQADQVRTGNQVSSDVLIPAPIDGIVIERNLNLGQVVTTSQHLFTVTDLTSVWIEGNLLENDFGAVRAGSRAVITTPAYPQRTYRGAVDYIDPRVDPQTRTAKVRVIVENRDLALRLGMYVDMLFTSVASARAPVVPAMAIQQIGPNTVVYIPQEEGNRFLQRNVDLGEETPSGRQVLNGLRVGERVVTDGSFLLRAESLRQHPR